MIKPAICYKEQIENALKPFFYSKDMMYYSGYDESELINVSENSHGGHIQYAVLDKKENLIGYISYRLDLYSSCAYAFGAFSFDRGNYIMAEEMYRLIETLVTKYHRVEFRAISGNPAIKAYDKFLKMMLNRGTKHILKDVFKDTDGEYHDVYIYEFINKEV